VCLGKLSEGLNGWLRAAGDSIQNAMSMKGTKELGYLTCKIGARQIGARKIMVAEVSSLKVDVGKIHICTKHSG
jgi:hypothetical protein